MVLCGCHDCSAGPDMGNAGVGPVLAFALTFLVSLIFIGCGLGAIVVLELTIKYIDIIKRYIYLKKGAMYSVLALSLIMVAEVFGLHVPTWLAPVAMVVIVAMFLYISVPLHQPREGSGLSDPCPVISFTIFFFCSTQKS